MRSSPHMIAALEEARAAAARGEVPVGAVVLSPDGVVVARAGNRTRELSDPSAHAEMLAIRAACAAAGSERLPGHVLYVTLEPCAMCAAVIAAARIGRVVYGAADPKSGGVAHGARVFAHPQSHHAPEVIDGIAAAEAEALLTGFFRARRGAEDDTAQPEGTEDARDEAVDGAAEAEGTEGAGRDATGPDRAPAAGIPRSGTDT